MFSKILIANRGEIACRVIRTAKRMGIKTVAVYSDADARAPHVEMADERVRLGPPPASESYLLADAIILACKETGAEAVHPGYGFLSERTSFAQALADAGIAFIGPPINAIAAMGDKIESKKLAKAAGVNVVPGFLGEIADTEEAVTIAGGIGYPVMMKASAGGGGKGMRLAWSEQDVREGFEATKREGLASFGDDRVFIEKFIESPRHIEIQLLGDRHGNIVYLNERECSIQRRHQKVVEEAPSPFVTPQMRKAMGEQAVALARAVGYYSAGTVELIVSGADTTGESFYFLEMNTRLQVEHPVTEYITGLDLVEQMIRVAYGEKLAFTQEDVKIDGWAIENRVYAEDPYRGFLPSTGRLVRYRPPVPTKAPFVPSEVEGRVAGAVQRVSTSLDTNGVGSGATQVRVDDGVVEGSEISMFYDPMIAKLVTHGPTREAAIDAQIAALDRFEIDGIGHNVDFLSALMQHPRFRSGNITTGFIAEEYPDGFHGAPADDARLRRLAAIAAFVAIETDARAGEIDGKLDGAPPGEAARIVHIAGQDIAIRFDAYDGGLLANSADDQPPLDLVGRWRPGQRLFSGTIDDEAVAVRVARTGRDWTLTTRGASHRVRVLPPHVAALTRHMIEKVPPDLSRFLLCPMPGLVTRIDVAPRRPGRGGAAAGGDRGDEDGEYPARREGGDGQVGRGQARRQHGGRCGDPRIRIAPARLDPAPAHRWRRLAAFRLTAPPRPAKCLIRLEDSVTRRPWRVTRRATGRAALMALAAMLSGCGGGGGSGGGSSPTSTITTPATPIAAAPAAATCSLRSRQDWAAGQLREWYLFPETLPASLDPSPYASVSDYVDALTATARGQRRDRYFTYLTSIAQEDAYYASGSSAGFGIRLATDAGAQRVVVTEAFEGAPALAAGIDRGTAIVAIGETPGTLRLVSDIIASEGTAGVTAALGPTTAGTVRTLRITNAAGTREVTVAKADYNLDPLSSRYGARIIDDGGRRVGYINLRTFISSAEPALRTAFANFRAAGITDFIVDLRYNGGGLVSTSQLFGDLLGGDRAASDVFSYTTFRPEKSARNETRAFRPQPQSVSPAHIALIGTGATASASELLINAFIPYLHARAALIGTNTYGKPVGQIALDRAACDDRLRVIAFATQNSARSAAYFDGLATTVEASCRASDDLTHAFGDAQEASTRAALDFIAGKSCAALTAEESRSFAPLAATVTREHELLSPERPNTAQREVPGLF